MGQTLFEKVWEAHAIRELRNGQTQLLIGIHFIHEVTSPRRSLCFGKWGLASPFPVRPNEREWSGSWSVVLLLERTFLHEHIALFKPCVGELSCALTTSIEAHD